VDVESVRYYPNGKIGAHILGYTGELTPEEYKAKRPQGYRLGDVVGKMGVEAAYESKLRGEWGGMQLEVNGSGQVIQILGQKIAKPGQDVTLTLDLKLQKAAEAALGKRKGAIVAIDPRDRFKTPKSRRGRFRKTQRCDRGDRSPGWFRAGHGQLS